MKSLGSALMAVGVLIGVAVGLALLGGVTLPGVSWFIAVGLVKLTLLAAVGLIGAGATLIRLTSRAAHRKRIGLGAELDQRP